MLHCVVTKLLLLSQCSTVMSQCCAVV